MLAPLSETFVIGQYQIVGELGVGGMATVYEAEHLGLRKRVALKVLRSDFAGRSDQRARFLREGVAASRIRHPHIVDILLDNPFVVERDIVAMAARRPTLARVIERVGLHLRWSLRYEVQRAVTLNPYSPTHVAVALLPFLRRNHLQETARDARLHDTVREASRVIEGWRFERSGRQAEPSPEPSNRH